jgi:hypothetical protein
MKQKDIFRHLQRRAVIPRSTTGCKKSSRPIDADMDPTEEPDPTVHAVISRTREDKTHIVDWQPRIDRDILNSTAESLHLMNTFWKLAEANFRVRRKQGDWRARRLTAVLDISVPFFCD